MQSANHMLYTTDPVIHSWLKPSGCYRQYTAWEEVPSSKLIHQLPHTRTYSAPPVCNPFVCFPVYASWL